MCSSSVGFYFSLSRASPPWLRGPACTGWEVPQCAEGCRTEGVKILPGKPHPAFWKGIWRAKRQLCLTGVTAGIPQLSSFAHVTRKIFPHGIYSNNTRVSTYLNLSPAAVLLRTLGGRWSGSPDWQIPGAHHGLEEGEGEGEKDTEERKGHIIIRKQVFQCCATDSYWYKQSVGSIEAPAGWGKHTKQKSLLSVDLRPDLPFVYFLKILCHPLVQYVGVSPGSHWSQGRLGDEWQVCLSKEQLQLPSSPSAAPATLHPWCPRPSFWTSREIQPSRKPGGEYNSFPLRDHVSTEESWVLFKHCKSIPFSLLSPFFFN